MEAKRHHNNPDFIPKWKSSPTSSISKPFKKCVNPKCTETVHEKLIKPSFTTTTELEEILGVKSSVDNPLILCQHCYNILYHQLHPSNCASCGAIPKVYKSFCRHSPNAVLVSQHFAITAGIDIQIENDDYICTNCYKMHCSIIKSLKSQQNGSDDTLHESIKIWKHTAENTTDLVTKATLAAVMYVAEHLLHKKAVLLPWACQVFLKSYGMNYSGSVNSVELYLDSHILYKCVHKKFGTILFRKGVDVLISLSWALGMLNIEENYTETTSKQHPSTSILNEKHSCWIYYERHITQRNQKANT